MVVLFLSLFFFSLFSRYNYYFFAHLRMSISPSSSTHSSYRQIPRNMIHLTVDGVGLDVDINELRGKRVGVPERHISLNTSGGTAHKTEGLTSSAMLCQHGI